MSTISKNYNHPSEADSGLFVTWEKNNKHFKIYSNGRLVAHLPDAKKSNEAAVVKDDQLGIIHIRFSTKSPEITVEKTLYTLEKGKSNIHDFQSVSTIFWILTGFSVFGAVAIQLFFGFNLNIPAARLQFIFDIIVIAIYAASAVFLRQGKGWAYFLGYSVFIFMTLLTFWAYNQSDWSLVQILTISVRGVFILYLATHFKNVLLAIREHGKSNSEELIDSI